MSLTLQQKLDRFPPVLCRLLARRIVNRTQVVALTDVEIAEAGGLPIFEVKGLSWRKNWNGVPVDIMLRFTRACGVDFDDDLSLKRNYWLASKVGRGKYLQRSPLWSTLFVPLIKHCQEFDKSGVS